MFLNSIPIICLFGLSANCVNTLVLYQKRVRSQQLFANYLMIAIADFIWLLFGLSTFVFRCGNFCSFGYSFGAKIYELYVFMLVGSICVTFKSIIMITIAFTSLMVHMERNYHLGDLLTTKSKCVICTILSILLNVVVIAITNIVVPYATLRTSTFDWKHENSTLTRFSIIYAIKMRDNIEKYDVILKTLMLFKDPVLYLTLFIMFLMITFNLIIRIQRKELIWRREGSLVFFKETQTIRTKENKRTLMTLSVCMAYLVGHSISSVFFIIAEFLNQETYYSLCDYLAIKDVLLFASNSVNLFIFYRFDLIYKRAFRSLKLKFHPRNVIWRRQPQQQSNMNSVRARLSSYPKPTSTLIESQTAITSPQVANSMETEASTDMVMELSRSRNLENELVEFVSLEKINDSVVV